MPIRKVEEPIYALTGGTDVASILQRRKFLMGEIYILFNHHLSTAVFKTFERQHKIRQNGPFESASKFDR